MSDDAVPNIEQTLDSVLWLGERFLPLAKRAVEPSSYGPERSCRVGQALSGRWGVGTGATVRWRAQFRGLNATRRKQALTLASASYPSGLVERANLCEMELTFCNAVRLKDWPTHYYRPAQNQNWIVAHTVTEFVHELWHLFQSQNPIIGLVEAEFRRQREAQGAKMFTEYAHKRYDGNTFTEVGSTAWEAFVGNYESQPDDEHLALVLGLMSALNSPPRSN